jgi:hypothetical protein
MNDNNDLRWKIDQAKGRLPLPELMAQVGLATVQRKPRIARSMTMSTSRFRYSRARTAGGTTSVLPDAATAIKSCSLEN